MNRAIVFVHATWSGISVQGLVALAMILEGYGNARPALIIVDSDRLAPDTAAALKFCLPEGQGETYWIQNGRLIGKAKKYNLTDKWLKVNTDCLVQEE